MRPNREQATIVESGGSLESISMTFDENSIQHLMSVLTDLYSDPELATIREISTNGSDSHRAAGIDKPIEVHLPSDFNRTFKVRDYGVGLSEDDIKSIYSKYGASTKRESDLEVGMLGLGCKAPLTYTTQFSLEAVKDGVKVDAVVSRNDMGAGVIEILHREYTDEPNGVQVSVPVSDAGSFNKKAENFFKYWEKGTVLIDGVEPEGVDGIEIDDNSILHQDKGGYYGAKSYIVMGGVPYPFTFNPTSINRQYGLVHYAPIGAVNFVPSREELHYTQRTKQYIEQLVRDIESKVFKRVEAEVQAADNIIDAYKRVNIVTNARGMRWRGYDIYDLKRGDAFEKVYNIRGGRASEFKSNTLGLWSREKFLVVTNYTNQSFGIQHARKCFEVDGSNDYGTILVFSGNKVPGVWQNLPVVDWNKAKSVRFGSTTTNGRTYGPSDTYDTWDKTDKMWKRKPTNDKLKYAYYSSAENVYGRDLVSLIGDDYEIVEVPRNRQAKFLRITKQAWHWKEVVQGLYDKMKPTIDELEYAIYLGNTPHVLNKMDTFKINDKEMRKIIETVRDNSKIDKTAMAEFKALCKMLNKAHGVSNLSERVFNKYPLLRMVSWYSLDDDVYEYMNALHEYRRNK